MRRGTAPTIRIDVPEVDLTEMAHVYVSFQQDGRNVFTKDDQSDDVQIDTHILAVTLTQKETLRLVAEPVYVQIRCITENGLPFATEIKEYPVSEIIMDGEI